jgi:7-cyano-7-deazaguanine synthase
MLDKGKSNLSVVLISGGLDSAVAAAVARKAGKTGESGNTGGAGVNGDIAALHINYGQRTEARELRAFNEISDYYGVKQRLVVDMRFLADIGGSALTDSAISVPTGDLSNKDIPITYVPFRNANMLAVAVSWAEVIGAESIYIGAVEEDSSGYPDCREEFFRAFEKLIETGTRPETRVKRKTPLIALTKEDIVKKGLELKAPLELTWSCYRDSLLACGECDSCLLRLRGFAKAGVEDRIKYASTKN